MKNILLILFLFPCLLFGQNKIVDSLKLVLKNTKNDTMRCYILNAMVDNENDDKLWPVYNQQLASIAEKNSTNKSSAGKKYKKIFLRYLASAYNNKGYLARLQGNIHATVINYQKGIEIQNKINDNVGIALSYHNIAQIFEMQGDIPQALEYNYKSLKIKESMDDTAGIAYSLNNIAMIYRGQGDLKMALGYNYKCLKFQKAIGNTRGITYSLNNIAAIYQTQGKSDKALEYFKKCLPINKQLMDKSAVAITLCNIGSIYQIKNELDSSLKYYYLGLQLQEEIGDKKGISSTYNNIAMSLYYQNNLQLATEFSNRSMELAKNIGYIHCIEYNAVALKLIAKKQNNYKRAIEMYELELKMRDSINNAENQKASVKKQLKYEFEKQAMADSVKHIEEQKIADAQIQVQKANLRQEEIFRYTLYGGLVLVIGFLIFVFNRFKVTKKQKLIIEKQKVQVDQAFEELHERNKELMDSIRYARRIQLALLPSLKYIEKSIHQLKKQG